MSDTECLSHLVAGLAVVRWCKFCTVGKAKVALVTSGNFPEVTLRPIIAGRLTRSGNFPERVTSDTLLGTIVARGWLAMERSDGA